VLWWWRAVALAVEVEWTEAPTGIGHHQREKRCALAPTLFERVWYRPATRLHPD
jgi:hypothetical protein